MTHYRGRGRVDRQRGRLTDRHLQAAGHRDPGASTAVDPPELEEQFDAGELGVAGDREGEDVRAGTGDGSAVREVRDSRAGL